MATNDNVQFYQRLLGTALLLIIAYLVFRIIEPFLGPIAWALFIGFLLQDQQQRLTKWMRGRASISAFTLTMLVLILFLGPLTALAIAFTGQATELAGRLQAWLGDRQGTTIRELDQIPGVGPVLDWLNQNLEITTAQVQAWLVDGGQTLFHQLASYGGVAFLGAIGTVLSFTVMLFILFFIIRDGRAIARLGSALVPLPPEPSRSAGGAAFRRHPGRRARDRAHVDHPGLCCSASGSRSPGCPHRSFSACSPPSCPSCLSAERRWSGGRR